MKLLLSSVCLPLLVAAALTGCGGPLLQSAPNPLAFTPEAFPSGHYSAKVDNVQILLDTSQSMDNDGQENLQSAKNFLHSVNMSLPEDFNGNIGLRTFGQNQQQVKNTTDLVYGMVKYSRDEMNQALEQVTNAWGRRPLASAISVAAADLEKLPGTSALLIVSDGSWKWEAAHFASPDAPATTKAIKEKMGDNLCVYTVWVGDVVGTHKMLEKVAVAGGCGFAESAVSLTDQKALAAYVEKVFLTGNPVPPVIAAPLEETRKDVTFNVLFGFDMHVIVDKMTQILGQAKQVLDEDPETSFVISGHADATGSEIYNQALSERRADSVMNWLVNEGVIAGRLETVGYGETQPREDNKTTEGRRLNRRVEIRTK